MPNPVEKWNSSSNAPAAPASGRAAGLSADEPSIDAAVLMGGRREVTILHAGTEYRLRVTANNKLILTK